MRPKFASSTAASATTAATNKRQRWTAVVACLCLVLCVHQLSSVFLGISYLWNDPLLISDDAVLLHPRSRTSSSRRSESSQEEPIEAREQEHWQARWKASGGSTRTSTSSSLRQRQGDSHNINQSNAEASVAACLLSMDDNHWLIEWLAYHYHVLPLRSLIVVQDPHSRTSPQPVLDRWKDRMNITVWKDPQFLKPWVLRQYKLGQIEQFRLHRYRQQFFYPACLKAFQARKHPPSWVLLVDTDELVRPNPYYPWSSPHKASSTTSTPYNLLAPGTVMQALRDYEQQSGQQSACLHIPRLQMSCRKDTDDAALSELSSSVPLVFNASHFLTTSWFYHGGKPIATGHDHLDGKNIIYVQRVSKRDIPLKTDSVHYVLPNVCPVKVAIDQTPLLIHHYLGTLEQFTSRKDPREAIPNRPSRNAQLYHSYSGVVRDTTLLPWLNGFVQQVGDVEAQRLLQGVGVVETTKS